MTLFFSAVKKERIVVFLFLCNLFIIDKDYGISLDEPTQRWIGVVNVQYIKEKLFSAQHNNEITKLDSLNDKDYGSAFEIHLVIAEQTIHPKTSLELYQLKTSNDFFNLFFRCISYLRHC
ncbi:hypothetical protein AS144_06065 [Francisella endosymbiont of Amblyomma maculatum]|nr:hypothetical protein AS144_06065 [Francisella endosymbiont of Amblyomma maculatum]